MAKPLMSDAEIKRRKKLQSHISIAGGTLGLAALGARGAGAAKAGGKLGKLTHVKAAPKASEKMNNLSNTLTTAGAGLGGVGAYNFAAYTGAESRKRVTKSMGVGMDFGLGGVRQGDAHKYEEVSKAWEEEVSKKDWMNISEHQRRASDSRRTRARGENIAGAGGALMGATAALGARNNVNVGGQAMRFGRHMRNIGGAAAKGKIKPGQAGKLTKLAATKSPYGAAVAGGAALMGAGAATAAAGGANAKRHNMAIGRQRKQRVGKAYDPERNRQRRKEHYATGLAMGSGASFVGAGVAGKGALGKHPVEGATKTQVPPGKKLGGGTVYNHGTGLRSSHGPFVRAGMKKAGKAGALGLAGVGLAVGSDRLRTYKKGRHR